MRSSLRLTIQVFLRGSLAGLVLGSSALAYGPNPQFAPSWTNDLISEDSVNSSFLGRSDYAGEKSFLSRLVDRDFSERKRVEYERMMDQYEQTRHYDQSSLASEKAHVENLSKFSQSIVSEVRKSKVKEETEKLHSVAEETGLYNEVKAPIGIAAALFAVYNGRAVNLNVEDALSLEARTDIPEKAGEFKLTSPLIDSAVRFQFADQNQDAITASLSRKLTDHVRCVFDASKKEESIRLEYGISF